MIMKIVSRETIKPSSPTPSHLHTYNLSEADLLSPRFYIPMVLFYPNNNSLTAEQKAIVLKKSLSYSLTRYYPFAGRLPTPTSTYVDCNDEGVLFLEAKNDTQIDTFQRLITSQETLDQLYADDIVYYNNLSSTHLVAVQLTHFSCGGLALAVSLSHAIGDACTLSSFLSHWAAVARCGSPDHTEVLPLNPHFMQSPRIETPPQAKIFENHKPPSNLVSRKFVFPNSKLSELKNKVASAVNNPTRVEVLTSLLHKTAVAAANSNSVCFKPFKLFFAMNVRGRLVPNLPQSTVGNVAKVLSFETRDESENSLRIVVTEMRKKKLQLDGVQSMQDLVEKRKSSFTKIINKSKDNVDEKYYISTSLCGFPFNKLDFGWGKPMGTSHGLRYAHSVLMDTVDGDGIEVLMYLEKECMEIVENDTELLSYCQTC